MVIYHDVGGAHSTAIAANMHVNRLPMDRVPDKKDLLSLATFDKIEKSQLGHLIYIGEDENKAKVYTIGRQYVPDLVVPAIKDLNYILTGTNDDILMVDTMPAVNLLMKIGGYTSRKMHLVGIGRPIVTYGSLQAYGHIIEIVKAAKNNLKLIMKK